MEQLVHLRLKSIYKAFKSSTAAGAPSSGDNSGYPTYSNGPGKSSSQHNRINSTTNTSGSFKIRDNDDPSMAAAAAAVDDLTPGALMLAAAASAAGPTSQLAAAAAASVAPGSQLAAAAHAAAGFAVQTGGATAAGGIATSSVAGRGGGGGNVPAVSAENYEAERAKAEEAAAALLAELDEEEQAVKTKKSKKKRKKERQQAKRAEQEQLKKTEEKEEDNVKETPTTRNPKGKTEKPQEAEMPQKSNKGSAKHQISQTKEKATDASSQVESKTNSTNTTVASSLDPVAEKLAGKKQAGEQPAVDPLECKFEKLLEAEDVPGLEELLASIKGVPGKAVLRKNVKKALKRLRVEPVVDTDEKMEEDRVTSKVATSVADQAPSTPAAPPSQLVTSGSVTPLSPRVADLLTIVSHNHNKVSSNSRLPKGHPGTPKSECIMQMAPSIVGWVIGKGGQRIRDLMEESGARIWIDQDSMGPQEPRTVYVSGQRNSVDMAVRMIHGLISKAPTDTPNSRQTLTPGAAVDSHHSQNSALNASLNLGKIPGLPGSNMGSGDGSTPFQLKPREKKRGGEHASKRELTCDPRFVPLLIGRRGWTIKNIQDSSGARVDIDQNVTPRKITISGTDAAVEIAARMVGDVLSYPHSLLHGAADDDEIVGAVMKAFPHGLNGSTDAVLEAAMEKSKNPPAGAGGETKDTALLESSSSPVDAVKASSHGSPPPSLIMPGDGKSTVSATSSLSSTPEPSVAASKGNPPQLPSASSLLPPTAYGLNSQRRPDSMLQQNPNYPPPPPQSGQQLPGQPLLHSGLHPHQEHTGLPMPQSNGFLQNGNGRGMPPQTVLSGQRSGPPPPDGQLPSWLERQPPQVPHYPPGDNRHHGHSLHQQHAFAGGAPPMTAPSIQGSANQLASNALAPQHQLPSNALAPQQHIQPPARPVAAAVGSSMWGERPNTESFAPGLPVNFLQSHQDSLGHHGAVQQGNTGQRTRVDEVLHSTAAPTLLEGPVHESSLPVTSNDPLAPGVKEDARVVDSLFGGSNVPRNDSADLVSGLCGLSLDPSPSANPWATSTVGFDLPANGTTSHEQQQTNTQIPNTSLDASSLYPSTTTPTTTDTGRQHSRFSWGESG